MSTNSVNVSSLIGKEIVATLHSEGMLINTVNKGYSKDFEQKNYRPGTTVTIDVEPQFGVTSGRVASVQPITHTSTSVTLGQYNAAVEWTSIEKGYSLPEIQKYARNLGRRMVRAMEQDGFSTIAKAVALSSGTAGTEPGSYRTFADARAKMRNALAPDVGNYAAVSPLGMAAIADSLKGMQNPGSDISNIYARGMVRGKMAGLNFYESNSIYRHTAGTSDNTTPLTNQVAAQTGSSLIIDAIDSGTTVTAGTKLTIAGVYAVDPETKATLSTLREFTVTANATAVSTDITLTISPAIIATGSTQNVSNGAANDKAVTFSNVSSGVSAMNLVYNEDAITLVSVPLPAAETKGTHSFQDFDGVKLRVGFGGWDAVNDTEILRVDAVWAWGLLRQDHCAVVHGA